MHFKLVILDRKFIIEFTSVLVKFIFALKCFPNSNLEYDRFDIFDSFCFSFIRYLNLKKICKICKCGRVCQSGDQLRKHIKNEHEERIIQCDISDDCNYTASSEKQLLKHKEIDHIKKICRFWIQNVCRFGSNCKFDHPVFCIYKENRCPNYGCQKYQGRERQKCRFQSSCTRPDCWYSHQLPAQSWGPAGREERDKPSSDSSGVQDDSRNCDIRSEQRDTRRQVLCRFNNNCTRPNCWFSHEADFLVKRQNFSQNHQPIGRKGRQWGI